jgi:hypothetical protein
MKVRKALATTSLEFVRQEDMAHFTKFCGVEAGKFKGVLAIHRRHDDSKDKIFLLPFKFLLCVEGWISDKRSAGGHQPDEELDVFLVSSAKLLVHEARHLIGTLVGVLIPAIVQPRSSIPSSVSWAFLCNPRLDPRVFQPPT